MKIRFTKKPNFEIKIDHKAIQICFFWVGFYHARAGIHKKHSKCWKFLYRFRACPCRTCLSSTDGLKHGWGISMKIFGIFFAKVHHFRKNEVIVYWNGKGTMHAPRITKISLNTSPGPIIYD